MICFSKTRVVVYLLQSQKYIVCFMLAKEKSSSIRVPYDGIYRVLVIRMNK